MTRLTIIVLIGLLTACQHSPKKNYYLLTPESAQPAQNTGAAAITTLIGIGPIEVSDYLNRLHVIYQTDDNSVIVADNDFWAEPLEKGIVRVIATNLTQRNTARTFVSFPWRSDSVPHYSVRLKVLSLNHVAGQASINATWEIFDNVKKVSVERRVFTDATSSKNNPKSLAKSYSDLLGKMSSDIDIALNKIQ